MTLEAPRRPEPVSDSPTDPQLQLADLLRKPPPSVMVIVKKNRLAATGDGAAGSQDRRSSDSAIEDPAAQGDRRPRVHRIRTGAGDGLASPRAAPSGDVFPGAAPAPAKQRRRVRDPQCRPGKVRIVVQAPAVAAPPSDDAPMWQRLLCAPAPEVSYAMVLRALDELQSTVDEARRASATCIF